MSGHQVDLFAAVAQRSAWARLPNDPDIDAPGERTYRATIGGQTYELIRLETRLPPYDWDGPAGDWHFHSWILLEVTPSPMATDRTLEVWKTDDGDPLARALETLTTR